ncbi:putative carboxymethylenebutenolidase [Rosa chinensis]|uniref:Putative carboxymethylenebutenolidase n=1 Tax=Rosa chinensis TaxID=74649 RepID=A0A2P6PW82_ROSCH|nr:endo-1,3;1,4-beta-D-glucanase [Rosa chinensis]PRQ26166.1 putative carboxymethylenebutenolidase [Rosa chinensis]
MLRMFTIVLHVLFVTLCLQLQQGVSGPQCLEHPPNLNGTSGAGSVIKVGGLKAYVTGPSHSKLAIILASDVYGFEAPNLRKIADKVASTAGFHVVVPDFFYGEPYNPNNTQRNMTVWLKDHGTDKGFEDAKRLIAALKNKGVSKIGAAGFCWGGKVVAELSKGYYTKAAVLLHPSRVTLDDIKAVKTPIAILVAQFDNGTPPELMKQFKEALSTNKIDNVVKIFPGVSHGWTVRYQDNNVTAVKSANEAHQDMLDWFTKDVQKR